ncbi:MAG TPA: 3-isopropylmalate dehydrogenase [Anaerolineae bacterium]|nr:3-isopropylmalate dehydrogenase [Anaerolineae bacterium]HIQ04692.1 3-isopropylmalate dehydrogenase [Anaerolineae bacterium]
MNVKITVLAGDGIGPEVTAEAVKVLEKVGAVFGHTLEFTEALIGGCAIDAVGDPLPAATLEACHSSDAVLLGAVGGPKWSDPNARVRPEQGLLGLRKGLGLFANLRPVKLFPELLHASTLRPEVLAGVDLLVVRELIGGVYFGPRQEGSEKAYDTMLYTRPEIERVVRLAGQAATERHGRLTSVDKANVLASSRLWRRVATELIASEFPNLEFEHMLVDAAAMHLIRRPSHFDVIVTGNLFGDILTDEASMLAGSMGMLPSASLGEVRNRHGFPLGVYEPIHGSAPDIAGQGVANPLAAILSAAMLLRHSLGLEEEAVAIENSVARVLADGYRTADIAGLESKTICTTEMGDLVSVALAHYTLRR